MFTQNQNRLLAWELRSLYLHLVDHTNGRGKVGQPEENHQKVVNLQGELERIRRKLLSDCESFCERERKILLWAIRQQMERRAIYRPGDKHYDKMERKRRGLSECLANL